MAAACTVLIVGTAVSVAISVLWYDNQNSAKRQTFVATTGDVSTALGTELRREADFVSTLRAVFTMEPRVGSSRFESWFDALQGRARLSGTLGTVVIRRSPAIGFAGSNSHATPTPVSGRSSKARLA